MKPSVKIKVTFRSLTWEAITLLLKTDMITSLTNKNLLKNDGQLSLQVR